MVIRWWREYPGKKGSWVTYLAQFAGYSLDRYRRADSTFNNVLVLKDKDASLNFLDYHTAVPRVIRTDNHGRDLIYLFLKKPVIDSLPPGRTGLVWCLGSYERDNPYGDICERLKAMDDGQRMEIIEQGMPRYWALLEAQKNSEYTFENTVSLLI